MRLVIRTGFFVFALLVGAIGAAAEPGSALEALEPGSAFAYVQASSGVVFVDLYAHW